MEEMLKWLLARPGTCVATCKVIAQHDSHNRVIGNLWVIEMLVWEDNKWKTNRSEGQTLEQAQHEILRIVAT